MFLIEDVSRTELTPLLFLERSSTVFRDKDAISYGEETTSYLSMGSHALRLGQALRASSVEAGDRVAYLMQNVPEMLIAHFGVPLVHAVIVAINTRLAAAEIAYIVEHSGAKLMFVYADLLPVAASLIEVGDLREIVVVGGSTDEVPTEFVSYEAFIARGSDNLIPWRVDDERRMIAINYTSGTTGSPKGVCYSHRGAYLNALAEVVHSRHSPQSVYLWTLPMFHCNGWCTTWAVTAIGGRHICMRKIEPDLIWSLIDEENVTHLNAAPTVLTSLVNSSKAHALDRSLTVTTAGAAPSPTVIRQMEQLGAEIVHVYGLTETYGPHTVCELQEGWEELPVDERSQLLARQGVAFLGAEPIRVVNEKMMDVPRDSTTLGEVVMRGNNVMLGYYNDMEATKAAFADGWFHSGDLAVIHPDGYIEVRDRAKDIVISGGENISTIEVEQVLVSHPSILEAAVVAMPHPTWGERPKAFVVLKAGCSMDPEDVVEYVRGRIAHYKAPDVVSIVEQLPKTSTGKVQKYVLRQANDNS